LVSNASLFGFSKESGPSCRILLVDGHWGPGTLISVSHPLKAEMASVVDNLVR
jgi:hypothetical protein